MPGRRRTLLLAPFALLLAACSGPLLANPVPPEKPIERPSPAPSRAPDPQSVVLPADDGPHDRLTEWWYFTGHLTAEDGRTFGFQDVIFRAERGTFPVSWASHLALTDEAGQRFRYDQRTEIGPQVDRSPRGPDGAPTGFDLAVSGFDPASSAPPAETAWTMKGANGTDQLAAESASGLGLDLALTTDRPPVLHDTVGFVDFGEAGGSYYYSRPRMTATGSLTVDGSPLAVTGEAWFDHQWGDFISVGGGGWDWFAVNLADGTDLTLSLVRDASGAYPLVYGTLVRPDGTVQHLARDAFTVEVLGSWTSPTTNARYPAAWQVRIPGEGLDIQLQPTVADQELDTRPSTGVVYWEGSQRVSATRNGQPVAGEAYVELTGYGPTP
jgi:predicted secreted hydrolase